MDDYGWGPTDNAVVLVFLALLLVLLLSAAEGPKGTQGGGDITITNSSTNVCGICIDTRP